MKKLFVGVAAVVVALVSVFAVQAQSNGNVSCGEGKVWFFYSSPTNDDPALLASRLKPENYRIATASEISVTCVQTVQLCAICAFPDGTGLQPSIEGEDIESELTSYDPSATTQFPVSADIKEKL